jgi:hypothetical protein
MSQPGRRESSLAIVLSSLMFVGCPDGTRGVEAESRRLAGAWADSATGSEADAPVATSASASKPLLVVDASRSMAGFAGCTNAPTEFNTTLDRISSDLSIVSAVRFGERGRGIGNVFETLPLSRAVHCAPFYDRLQNPDYALFERARADTSGTVFLYLTDGVQSDWRGPNPGPSVGLLKEWVASKRGLAIVAFRSRFQGQAWSEQSQRMLGNVSVERRPFYLFVLAPTDEQVDALLRQLSRAALTNTQVIRFGADAVSCAASVADKLPKYRRTESPPWAWVKHDAIARVGSVAKYTCAIRSEFPLASVRPSALLEYRGWDGTRFEEDATVPKGVQLHADSASVADGRSTVILSGTLPFDNRNRFGLYHVRLNAEPGELRQSVEELSTDNDATPDTFDRTYRFSWVIEQLARAHLAQRPWTPLSVTVQYR